MDYGNLVRRGTGPGFLTHQLRLLKLFLLCNDRYYSKAVVQDLLLSLWDVKVSNSLAHFKQSNLSAFNEEIGEISLSMLHRCVAATSSRVSVTDVNKRYVILSPVCQFIHRLHSVGSFSKTRHHRISLFPDSPEVVTAIKFLESVLVAFAHNSVTIYSNVTSTKKKSSPVPVADVAPLLQSSRPILQTFLRSFKKKKQIRKPQGAASIHLRFRFPRCRAWFVIDFL